MAPQSHTPRKKIALRKSASHGSPWAPRKVDAVVAYGQPSAIEAGGARAADVYYHAIRVAIHTMRNLVLVEKAQTMVFAHVQH